MVGHPVDKSRRAPHSLLGAGGLCQDSSSLGPSLIVTYGVAEAALVIIQMTQKLKPSAA